MAELKLCYCHDCNLEFSSTVFQCCPVCLSKVDATSIRPVGRLAFLFKPLGEKAKPIIRMHADQKRIRNQSMLLCLLFAMLLFGVGVLNLGLGNEKFKGGLPGAVAVFAMVAGIVGVILAIIVGKLKYQNPVEILPDGRLRIPRGMSHSRGIASRLIQTIATASRSPDERFYYVVSPENWLKFVDEMGRDESLSLAKQFEPIVAQFFGHVDSQIQEIRYALRDLAKSDAPNLSNTNGSSDH